MPAIARKIAAAVIIFAFIFNVTNLYASTAGTVNDNGVNVRRGPSTNTPVIDQVNKDQKVTITGSQDGFYHVYYPGMNDGWISAQFVTTSSPAPVSSQEGRVTTTGVNIRSAPSTSGAVLGQATTGETFRVTGSQTGWYKIIYNNADAYISSDFLQVGGAAAPVPTPAPTPESAAAATGENTGRVTGTNVNIRSQPSTTGAVLGQAVIGTVFQITGKQDNWYKVVYNNADAYINSEFLFVNPAAPAADPVMPEPTQPAAQPVSNQTETIYAVITAEAGLYMRQRASADSPALNVFTFGEVVDVTSIGAEWVGVTYDGVSGFVSAEFVTVNRGIKPDIDAYHGFPPSELATEIIEYGKQFLGTPYSWGGTDLERGVDCSGFVFAVMREHGINLNRSSSTMVHNGYTVQKSQLRPGDLVFFSTDTRDVISHVGIYMGNRRFIHSSSSARTWGVTISSLDESYYVQRYITANRVIS